MARSETMDKLKPLEMGREAMEKDPVLRRMLKIRRYSSALCMSNILTTMALFLTLFKIWWLDLILIAYMIGGYAYSRTFRIIEKKNAKHLRSLGFTVNE